MPGNILDVKVAGRRFRQGWRRVGHPRGHEEWRTRSLAPQDGTVGFHQIVHKGDTVNSGDTTGFP